MASNFFKQKAQEARERIEEYFRSGVPVQSSQSANSAPPSHAQASQLPVRGSAARGGTSSSAVQTAVRGEAAKRLRKGVATPQRRAELALLEAARERVLNTRGQSRRGGGFVNASGRQQESAKEQAPGTSTVDNGQIIAKLMKDRQMSTATAGDALRTMQARTRDSQAPEALEAARARVLNPNSHSRLAGEGFVPNAPGERGGPVLGGAAVLDGIQTGLDIAGLIPAAGELADGINALIYAARGDPLNAGLSAMAMVPVAGSAATGGKLAKKAMKYGDEIAAGVKHGDEIVVGAGKLKVIDGRVGGKVPVDEYHALRQSSMKNPNSDSLTLGKYAGDVTSYTKRAGDSSYFDMGNEWNAVRRRYSLSGDEMFNYFNKPILDDAISGGKTIRFSHDPRLYETGFIVDEWEYIKSTMNLTDGNLVFEGGFWIVK